MSPAFQASIASRATSTFCCGIGIRRISRTRLRGHQLQAGLVVAGVERAVQAAQYLARRAVAGHQLGMAVPSAPRPRSCPRRWARLRALRPPGVERRCPIKGEVSPRKRPSLAQRTTSGSPRAAPATLSVTARGDSGSRQDLGSRGGSHQADCFSQGGSPICRRYRTCADGRRVPISPQIAGVVCGPAGGGRERRAATLLVRVKRSSPSRSLGDITPAAAESVTAVRP